MRNEGRAIVITEELLAEASRRFQTSVQYLNKNITEEPLGGRAEA